MGQNPFVTECFQNVLCIPFIKCLMTNVTKPLQMNFGIAKQYFWSEVKLNIFFSLLTNKNIIFIFKTVR